MSAALPEVPLETGALVVADLHLDPADAEHGARFARWLGALGEPPRLVILGDLFDAWVGPAHARLAGGRAVIEALASLHAAGTAIDLVPGNRDFLLDAAFERASGARLRPGGMVGVLGEARALFVHGDELCTRDVGYQRLRRVLRSGPVQWLGPRLPLAVAAPIARRLRRASVRALEVKLDAEKALQPDACVALAAAHRARTLVCGHAHRARDESLPGGPRWIVLDAWGGARDLLRVRAVGELGLSASRA